MLIHCVMHCPTWAMLVNSNAMTTEVWFRSQVLGKPPSEEPPPQMGINYFGVSVGVCERLLGWFGGRSKLHSLV